MVKRNRTNNDLQKIEQQDPHKKPGVKSCTPEWCAVPTPPRVNSDAPEGSAVPTLPVAPVN